MCPQTTVRMISYENARTTVRIISQELVSHKLAPLPVRLGLGKESWLGKVM